MLIIIHAKDRKYDHPLRLNETYNIIGNYVTPTMIVCLFCMRSVYIESQFCTRSVYMHYFQGFVCASCDHVLVYDGVSPATASAAVVCSVYSKRGL